MENFAEIDMNKISKKYSNFWSGFCRIRIEFVFNGPLGSKSVFKLLITEPRLDEKIKRVKMHILFCFYYFLITATVVSGSESRSFYYEIKIGGGSVYTF